MRTRCLAAVLGATLLACSAAPTEDVVSDDELVLGATDTSLSSDDIAALADGRGILGCTENLGEATLCT